MRLRFLLGIGFIFVNMKCAAAQEWPRFRRPNGSGVKGQIETVYKLDRAALLVPTPIVKDDLLFLWDDRGFVSCCSVKSGANHWRERVEGGFYAWPVIAGQHVYCPSREGDMIVLAASKKFEQAARIPRGEGTQATPALAGGRLFVRTNTRVMCLGGKVKRE